MIEKLEYVTLVIFFSLFYIFAIIHHVFYRVYKPYEKPFPQFPRRPYDRRQGDLFNPKVVALDSDINFTTYQT